MTDQFPEPLVLSRRFVRILSHYTRHAAAIEALSDDWAIDPYAWDHDAGVILTPIESALWSDIRAEDLVLYPQYPVGRYFVDFANPAARVAIECDGARWHTDEARDQRRQAAIEAMSWTVYRIGGRDCLTDTEIGEDDAGRMVVTVSAARRFIRRVAARHPIKRVPRRIGAQSAASWLPPLIDVMLIGAPGA